MEKRLFYRDPVTGIEAPLLIFEDDQAAIDDISVNKQDKVDPSINSDSHDVVTTINELNWRAKHTMTKPEEPGTYKQVLTLDASGNYVWADKQENLPVFDIVTTQSPWTVGLVDFGTFDEREFMTFLAKTPSATNAANCTINGEPVTMNHTAINASVLVPEKLYLCTHEEDDARFDFVEIHNMSTISHNLTTNLILQDSSDPNIYTYSKEDMDDFFDGVRQDTADTKVLLGDVSKYDPWSVYVKDDYVLHDGSVYRCAVEKVNGRWNPDQWTETDMMNEIFELRGGHPIYTEIVTVKMLFDVPHTGFSGDASVTVSYPEETGIPAHTYDLSSGCDYQVQFFVIHGETYYVDGAPVSGFVTPSRVTNTAAQRKRTVNLLYKPNGSGVFIIDDNGVETDYTAWNPANNAHAKYVELTNSTLCPGGSKPDNSIVISKAWSGMTLSGKYCVEGKDFPSLTNYTSYTEAAMDYDGFADTSLAYDDCTALDASGYTFWQRYNEAHASEEGFVPVDVNGYIPAITGAWGKTESFLTGTVRGYVASFGQMKQIMANFNDVSAAFYKIGSTCPTFSGQWWTATEYSAANMNTQNNKGDRNLAKTSTASTIVLMDVFRR